MKKASARDIFFYVILLVIVVIAFVVLGDMQKTVEPVYSEVRSLLEQEAVREIDYKNDTLTLTLREPYNGQLTLSYTVYDFNLFYADFNDLVVEQYHRGVVERYDYPSPNTTSIWTLLLPNLILIGVFALMMFLMLGRATGGGEGGMRGGAAPAFTRSKAKDGTAEGKKKTFRDVAGADEEKAELQEIVDFLKDSAKFIALGARIPKGVLLVGPPGTGKTLLAKAVAGEAGVQFLTISGSDFVELYVGVGASRVRDLFTEAKAGAPCIVFIDEIDAVGRQRGAGLGGGHDEREQTLNQLLVEMDGFGSNEGVIVLAATNRQDILDPALLRPGRFDRQIYVGIPDVRGREEILKIHSRGKPLADDVSLQSVAQGTAGFTGADLENLMNEAALLAARRDMRVISKQELDEAILKVIAGPEKRSKLISDKEKRLVAYHEAGHAVVTHAMKTHDPVHHITIISRGGAGGMTVFRPEEDKNYITKTALRERILVSLGGRAAEELELGDISTGAGSDLRHASETARNMVTRYGMSGKVGNVVFGESSNEIFIGRSMAQQRSYSEEMASLIDREVKELLDEAYAACLEILRENKAKLDAVAQHLLRHETMSAEEFKAVMEA